MDISSELAIDGVVVVVVDERAGAMLPWMQVQHGQNQLLVLDWTYQGWTVISAANGFGVRTCSCSL
ncbi:hypothetical protein [Oryza sativa Japonica Group]|uniref:Uncharacterized protein n=1 Tax=Oryza sativa subsp. japonica TaxID=39947 RepID=Q5JK40_ORYSJ|nr:hypothetical protein [Oryza sativa Japonica Group]